MPKLNFLLLLVALTANAQTSVVTYHNDNGRTGQYLNEILLTPSNVKSGLFGKRFFLLVDGAVYAQPLYLSRVKIAGKGFHNILLVATAHDSLFAFDADDESGSGAQPLWRASFIDPAHGVTTVSQTDVNCPVIPELGITGTPVIDANAGTIYLIAETKEPGNQFVFRLHAIDVTSGAERPGSPVIIQPPGFVPVSHKQRTGLLLSNGMVYSSWSGHCDLGTYHGWLMAHDASTLKLAAFFNDTPDTRGASFWNGGAGPAADADGNIYVVSANADFDGNVSASRYDESVLKLSPAPQLSIEDLFTPFNQSHLDYYDLDLGSSGALLLPDEAGNAAHPHLLFTSGKEGRLYLLDQGHLGGPQTGSDGKALSSLPVLSQGTFGLAAYFNHSIYIGPANSPMFAFPVANASLALSPSARASNNFNAFGATPSVSANGDKNGIVWAISVENDGTLRAYNAADLTEIYNSNAQPADTLSAYAEFTVPAIADGKVFAGNFYGVTVYGQQVSDPPVISAVTNAASYRTDAISPGSLISIFGTGLAGVTASAPGLPLPLSLADVSVTVHGVVAPLLFVSPQQINAQVPSAVAAGSASIIVRVSGILSSAAMVTLSTAAPGIFTGEEGRAAALNQDHSPNQPEHPAPAGSFVSVFFTGQGPVDRPVDDGAPAPAGPLAKAAGKVSATIGGLPAEVQFAGLAPGYAGLAQINLKVPALGSGTFPVLVSIGGFTSNAANLTTQ